MYKSTKDLRSKRASFFKRSGNSPSAPFAAFLSLVSAKISFSSCIFLACLFANRGLDGFANRGLDGFANLGLPDAPDSVSEILKNLFSLMKLGVCSLGSSESGSNGFFTSSLTSTHQEINKGKDFLECSN